MCKARVYNIRNSTHYFSYGICNIRPNSNWSYVAYPITEVMGGVTYIVNPSFITCRHTPPLCPLDTIVSRTIVSISCL